MVEGGGFEPPKSLTTDLQSVPFGRSGIPPDDVLELSNGADDGTRTRNLLITSQLLYQLSYASLSSAPFAARSCLAKRIPFLKQNLSGVNSFFTTAAFYFFRGRNKPGTAGIQRTTSPMGHK